MYFTDERDMFVDINQKYILEIDCDAKGSLDCNVFPAIFLWNIFAKDCYCLFYLAF